MTPPRRLILFAALAAAASATRAATDTEALFVRRVAPLLREKCLACHGQDEAKLKGGLDLRTRAEALIGGDSTKPSLVAGRPEESPLYLAARRNHDDWKAMPPKESEALSPAQLGWLHDWIAGGAPWPDAARQAEIRTAHAAAWSAEDGVTVATSRGLSADWNVRRYRPEDLWAYQPVRKPAIPAAAAGTHPIDAFLEERLANLGLASAPPANARTLIRRMAFSLTGLPPPPEEVAAFERAHAADPRGAVAALADRLLASPHHGERMAQNWLDVTRYADTAGFANDYDRGGAWRYRDYVVRAFNADKPFDRFVREQVAGDEIEPDNPEAVVATGFLRMGPWELTGMEVAKVARQRFLDDVTNAVGETFLAQPLQCARCHDHKFDPVPTRDYYSIQAVFATTQLSERPAAFLPGENTSGFAERKYLERRREDHLAALRRLDERLLENADTWLREKGIDPARWQAAVAQARAQERGGKRREFEGVFATARTILTRQKEPEDRFPPKLVGFTPQEYGEERVARKGLERLRWELDRYEPFALAVYNGRTPEVKSVNAPVRMPASRLEEGELEQTCILTGGDPFSPGEKVAPGALSAIGVGASFPEAVEGRRTALANWIASAENPFTARVIVNRVWQWHFGRPLAANPNNFGVTGGKPSHPALLDWLAATLVEQGWSLKRLHRLIVTSAAYQRASAHPERKRLAEKDPAGTSLAVFPLRRLSAEELRDAMLAASGELNREIGGVPNRPEINPEVALQPRQVMGTFAAAWVPNVLPAQRHRRSLYALRIRGLPDPAMEVFNQPGPDFSCEQRDASTVTPQVFSLFNGAASHARALALAHRAWVDARDEAGAVTRCFELTLGRPPSAAELADCLAHWRDGIALAAEAAPTLRPPAEVRREAVEENTGERFTFSERLHAAADFKPDLQPTDVSARTRALADVCLVLLNGNEFAHVE